MQEEDSYRTIASRAHGSFRDKASKFIGIAIPVSSEEVVKKELLGLRKEYHDANHHCYAYRLGADGAVFRFNDDGEPSGSAGKPIYGQILSTGVTNVLVVVVRYFGGTKLGIPGLINAYKTSAREALDQAGIAIRSIEESITVSFDYPVMNEVMRVIKEENGSIQHQEFETACLVRFSVKRSHVPRVLSRFERMNGVSAEQILTRNLR
jgi:uncharacterized YigZ family protein